MLKQRGFILCHCELILLTCALNINCQKDFVKRFLRLIYLGVTPTEAGYIHFAHGALQAGLRPRGSRFAGSLSLTLYSSSLTQRLIFRQFYSEFKCLARPVLEFTATEFGANAPLASDLGDNLATLPPTETYLANGVCQIRQAVIAQSKKMKLSAEDELTKWLKNEISGKKG